MTSTLRSALLAAAALAAATPAWAQQPSPPPAAGQGGGGRGPGALFEQMDGNKDDRVTWDEAWRYVQQRFAAADSDRDGGLTRQEAEALRPTGGGRRQEGGASAQQPTPEQAARRTRFGDVVFRSLDANRDSRVTLDEVRPAVESRFRGLDADADNAVSRAELPQRRGGGPRPQGGAGQGNQSGQTPAAPR